MRILSLLFTFFLLLAPAAALAQDVYVNGYHRKDGTYVQPHYRSAPDGNPYNNWSFQGNTNPYTGKSGTQTYNQYQRQKQDYGNIFRTQKPKVNTYGGY